MTKILVGMDEMALAEAMEVLGTKTKKDTIDAALREVAAQRRRAVASQHFRELADSGRFDFDVLRKPSCDE